MEDFEGFYVVIADGYTTTCTKRIRVLYVTMGNYMLTDNFYVVDLADTHMVLGVKYTWRHPHEISRDEDGVQGQIRSTSYNERYVDMSPQDHVK
jgi:hypothetical protein